MSSAGAPVLVVIAEMEPEARNRCLVDLTVDDDYSNILKGCYIKCFEFCNLSQSLSPQAYSYFLSSALRGICEDFIVLNYLKNKKSVEERSELILNRMMLSVFDGAAKQKIFFKKRRPFQPVFAGVPKTVLPKKTLPPVRNMAAAVALEDVYDFVYAITSDVVHFNPRVILRNAWGSDKEKFQHSVNNFDVYYVDFCQTYSLFFLCLMTRVFQDELSFSLTFILQITKLEQFLNEKLRWPEAVTFEEMNLEAPGEIMRVVLKAAFEGESLASNVASGPGEER